MLSTLRIKNLALAADLTLPLQPGFNALTGETGAGKSIIIGGLNLVLGERADRTLIRGGCDSCSVEAVFDLPAPHKTIDALLDSNGIEPCADDQLILKRVLTASGANRQFINGSPATLQILAALGRELVDMHGPHEHQSLLQPARQLDILDAFAGVGKLRGDFAATVQKFHAIEEQKAALIVDERTYAQQLDLLRFQVQEISAARLQPDEEARVEADFQRASNAARLLELSQNAQNLLSDADAALLTQAGELGRLLQSLARIDTRAADLAECQSRAVDTLRELQSALRRYADSIEMDPASLQKTEERLNLIHSLKRKYGASLASVIAFGDDAAAKLRSLEQRDAELARLNAELDKAKLEIQRLGRDLSARRSKAIPRLAKAAMQQLGDLGFAQCHFDITLTSVAEGSPVTLSGLDEIEFQFAPNPGEPARPLRAIASSGEMSRVMLALKTVLAAEDEIPLLVFDEIDANVGGETARVVGEKMRQIAKKHQLICITHLPPVAAAASTHFVVGKRTVEGRTLSEIKQLDKPGRVREIARMLGGHDDAVLRHARALLG